MKPVRTRARLRPILALCVLAGLGSGLRALARAPGAARPVDAAAAAAAAAAREKEKEKARDLAAFKKHVAAATKLYKQGQLQASIAELHAAQALRPTPRLLCNLARAHRDLSDYAQALSYYEECLKTDDTLPPGLRADIEQSLEELRASLSPQSQPRPDAVTAGQAPAAKTSPARLVALPVRRQWEWRARPVFTSDPDGTTVQSAPGPHSSKYLLSVWGSSERDLWAVGSGGVIMHYEGITWKKVPSGVTDDLYGVWGSGPRDVWAVGESGAILHYDGTAWTAQRAARRSPLHSVWGSGPQDVWIVGDQGTILHFQGLAGSDWIETPSRTQSLLLSVWGTGAETTWAVGVQGVILRREGGTWVRVQSGTTESLFALTGTRPDALWAVGEHGVVSHYDGQQWTAATTPTDKTLFGAWSVGTQVWAAGAGGALVSWDGRTWAAHGSSTLSDLRAIWGATDATRSTVEELWVVGLNGLILNLGQ